MSPTASGTGRRADDWRGAETRREADIKRRAPEYERELRRHELALVRSLTQVLPTDRPAKVRELADARRVMAGAIRDLQGLKRELEADLRRYGEQRSHNQRELLAYEAVDNEIDEVLTRWEARRDQLSAAVERGSRRGGGSGSDARSGRDAGSPRHTGNGRSGIGRGRDPGGRRDGGGPRDTGSPRDSRGGRSGGGRRPGPGGGHGSGPNAASGGGGGGPGPGGGAGPSGGGGGGSGGRPGGRSGGGGGGRRPNPPRKN